MSIKQLLAAWSGVPLAIDSAGLNRFVAEHDPEEDKFNGVRRDPIHGRIENGIGFLDIEGALAARSNGWLESYEDILGETLKLAADDSVKGVLLRLDTPGGEFSGAIKLAESLRAIGAEKPIWTVADDFAASAGQLILAQGNKAFVERNGHVGSIGVIMVHFDVTKALSDFGFKVTHIRNGARKAEGGPFEKLSEKARDGFQASVDEAFSTFVAQVVAGRGGKITSEQIIETESILLSAKEGLALGLVDGFATSAEAMEQMKSQFGTANPGQVFVAADTGAALRASEETPGTQEEKEGHDMAEKAVAAAPTGPAPEAKEPYSLESVAEGVAKKGLQEAEVKEARRDQIESACAIAGLGIKEVQAFVASDKTAKQVSAELVDQRAEDDEKNETASHSAPSVSEGGPADMLAAADRYCEQHNLKPVALGGV